MLATIEKFLPSTSEQPVLVLVGPRAFSKFRLEFINRSLDVLQNGLRLDDAHFFYLVNLSSTLDKEEVKNLCSLLQSSGNLLIKKDPEFQNCP